MRPNAIWTALIALMLSLALVACCWDAFKSRSVEFRYRVVDRELAPLFEKSYVFFISKKDPVYTGRQLGKVDASRISADGFVNVFVPEVATGFRLDVAFRDVPNMFQGRKELVLEVDVSGSCREIRLPFRKDKPFYAWASFAAQDFMVVRFNALACMSVLCMSWVFCFMLVSAFRRMSSVHENILFACLFAAVCALPSAKMDKSDASSRENRRLKRFPGGGLAVSEGPSAWCKQFEAAFADRFFCRYWLMDVHSAIVDFFDDRGNAKVHVGRDGWLFLKPTLNDFSNAAQMYDQRTMERIFSYLDSIGDYAKRNGKKFVFFIAPDKCRVYPEQVRFLKKIRPDSESRTERLVAYLRERCDFPVIYPREEMARLKDSCDFSVYRKQDTHWTYEGAYNVGYKSICSAIDKKELQSASEQFDGIKWKSDVDLHDLANMLGRCAHMRQDCMYRRPDWGKDGVKIMRANTEKGDVETKVTTISLENGLKLYCLRDSFCEFMIPFFARVFSRCVFRHQRKGIVGEDLEYIRDCDVILLEIVERDLLDLVKAVLPAALCKEVH